MNVLEEAILTNPQLDDRDVRVILVSIGIQNRYGKVRQKQIADSLQVSISTIERRFRKYKKEGLVLISRVKSHEWRYDFSPLISNVNLHLGDGPLENADDVALHTDDGSQTNKRPNVNLHLSDGPPHEINLTSCISKKTSNISLDNNYLEDNIYTVSTQETAHSRCQEDADMSRVTGPPGSLHDIANEILDKSTKVAKKKDRYAVKKSSQYEKFKSKSVEEYNCNDMWYVYRESWDKKKWSCRATGYTKVDRKKLKDLISEQGSENIVALIKYVIAEWEDLCKRYKINGYPSVAVMYGYRRSWLPEALNGKQQTVGWGAEFSGKDFTPGSWG